MENENNSTELSDEIEKYGDSMLYLSDKNKIQLLTIIGEIEGHDNSPKSSKTTKYEHILPKLAIVEHDKSILGVLVLINTVGGDVEAGLAIAEMLASISKPVVTLVLGGSHSIGVPLSVSADYSFIVETGTMVIHPVRTNGIVLGVAQSFEYLEKIQERIVHFTAEHSKITEERFRALMLNTKMLTKDLGTLLRGMEAVDEGIIDEVGGIRDALNKLYELIGTQESV